MNPRPSFAADQVYTVCNVVVSLRRKGIWRALFTRRSENYIMAFFTQERRRSWAILALMLDLHICSQLGKARHYGRATGHNPLRE